MMNLRILAVIALALVPAIAARTDIIDPGLITISGGISGQGWSSRLAIYGIPDALTQGIESGPGGVGVGTLLTPNSPPVPGTSTASTSAGYDTVYVSGDTLTFTFDKAYAIDDMWIWNYNKGIALGRGINTLTIDCSTDGIDWTNLINTAFELANGAGGYTGFAVDFGDVWARYVRFSNMTTHGADRIGLNGVAFITAQTSGLGFESDQSGAVETVSPASVSVILAPASSGPVTVDYTVTGGTAIQGDDYVLTPGTVSFAAGQTRKTIDFTVINDGQDELDETVVLQLSNLTGGGDVGLFLNEQSTHTYTIIDPRPHVSFLEESGEGNEDQTPVEIAVTCTPAASETITVDYAAAGGTAESGQDYVLEPGTLTFAPGQTIRYITLQPLPDELEEDDETILIGLFNITGNAIIGPHVQYQYLLTEQRGFQWDALTWYRSSLVKGPGKELYWPDPDPGEMVIVRIPEMPLINVGDVAEVSYLYMGQGDGIDDGGIGTGDIRFGLFDSNGSGYPDNASYSQIIFCGYLGYKAVVSPHLSTSYGGRMGKRIDPSNPDEACQSLLQAAEGPWGDNAIQPKIPGLELPVGQWSLLTLRCQRTSATTVVFSVTLNGRTETFTDDDQANQPQKIDVFAMYFANDRPFDLIALDVPPSPKPANPNPRNGAVGVKTNVVASWRPGQTAVSQDIYFGTGHSAVSAADRSSGLYRGNQEGRYFYPGPLDLNRTYYWRIDDVAAGGGTVAGDVWSFTTVDCLKFEDFESYDDEAALADQWQGAGAAEGYVNLAAGHTGARSMRVEYYNFSPYSFSEAGRHFSPELDLTAGPGTVGLYYRGQDTGNIDDRMYLIVEDAFGSTVEVSHFPTLTTSAWQAWGISLENLSGVDLSRIAGLRIGIGDPAGSPSKTYGAVYIDDIGLCRGRCVAGPSQDLNDDCIVNFGDHAVKAQSWANTAAKRQDYKMLAEQWLEEILIWP